MPHSHPHYSGLAIWVYSLIKRIDKAKNAMDNLYFIGEHKDHKEAMEKYTKLRQQLDQYITKNEFQQWQESMGLYKNQDKIDECMQFNVLKRIEKETEKNDDIAEKKNDKLNKPVRKTTYLESNFDVQLLRVLIEMQYWQKVSTLGLNFPMCLSKLLMRKDQLRVLRESVMLIVRDYNNIITLINVKETNLFSEHLKSLDKVIESGLTKINWQNNADQFVMQCRNECSIKFQLIKKFKADNQKIQD